MSNTRGIRSNITPNRSPNRSPNSGSKNRPDVPEFNYPFDEIADAVKTIDFDPFIDHGQYAMETLFRRQKEIINNLAQSCPRDNNGNSAFGKEFHKIIRMCKILTHIILVLR